MHKKLGSLTLPKGIEVVSYILLVGIILENKLTLLHVAKCKTLYFHFYLCALEKPL